MKYITEAKILEEEIKKFYNEAPTGYDTETTSLDPYKGELRTMQFADGENTIVIDVRKVGKEAVAEYTKPVLTNPKKIKSIHNAKFDLKFTKHHLGLDVEGIFDSFIGSTIIEGGVKQEKGFHGLGQVSQRYGGLLVDKDEQLSDWSGELSESQITYAGKDAEALLHIKQPMVDKLRSLGLIRCAKLEFDAVLPVAWLELCGFYLDFDQWMNVANQNLEKADEVADRIYKQLAPFIPQQSLFGEADINLGSPQQVQKYFAMAGVELPESTKEWMLLPLVDRWPIVQDLIDYRGYNKAGNDFGEKFKTFINPATGRIHADFYQIGAETGRMSCNKPNLMQIPRDVDHRNCFKAEEGNSLLSLDYSQIELRILADLARDKVSMAAFESGVDYHTAMAARTFKKDISEVDSEMRSFAKRLNFGIAYGIGEKRFAMQAGITVGEATIIMKDYFDAVKNIKRWLNFQKWNVLKEKSARSVSGRIVFYDWDDADWMKRSEVQRYACNFPIQASSADMLKRALRLCYDVTKPYHDHIKMVNVVHDEINFEVRDDLVDTVYELTHKAMVDAGNEFVKEVGIKVDHKIKKYWEK
jgi:DNA polymerase-1